MATNRNQLLVVDDNGDILKVLRFLFAAHPGLEPLYASSCAAAIRLANEHREQIFLTVLDLNLPDPPTVRWCRR